MPPPEPQEEGALVRRWDGHMVAGGRGHGAEASSSRVGRSASGEGRVDGPPAFADAREEQEHWGELRDHGTALNRALNEALRIHGGPAWRVFQVRRCCPFSSISSFSVLVPRGVTLTGFGSLAAGARAPRPRQVRHLRSDECRAPPPPRATRRHRRACGGLEDSRRLAVVPGGGPTRSALGVRGAGRSAPFYLRADSHSPHRSG
jgi:hypothetical protein